MLRPAALAAPDAPVPDLVEATEITTVQPGGGFCFGLEVAWGRLRRAWLRAARSGYVRAMQAKRQGTCPGCPHDVIDARDLKLVRNVCGYAFRPEDDAFRWRDRLRLARYGLAEVVVSSVGSAAAIALVTAFTTGVVRVALLAPLAVLWYQLVWFFRDPTRVPPGDPRAVLSPADGVVTHLDEVDAPGFPGGRAFRVSIYLSVWNVHLSRLPRGGKVVELRYFRGKFLNARHRDCVRRNEQLWMDVVEPGGRRMRLKQISGALARRLVCAVRLGEEVGAGDRYGLIKYGSRMDVLLPTGEERELVVKVGDLVAAGTSVLLRLPEGA